MRGDFANTDGGDIRFIRYCEAMDYIEWIEYAIGAGIELKTFAEWLETDEPIKECKEWHN